MTAPAVTGWQSRSERPPFKNTLAKNDARAEIENRASVESLELLHYERRQAIETLAPLDVLFGSGGERWDATRKRHRNGIAKLILTEMETDWNKPTGNPSIVRGQFKPPAENALDRMANSDPRHVKFVEETEGQYAVYLHAKNKLAEIEERIESRLAEMRFVIAETRIQG